MPHLCRDDRRTQAKKRLDAFVYDRFRETLGQLPIPQNYKELQLLTSSYSQLVGASRVAPIFASEQDNDKANHAQETQGKRLASALNVLAKHTDNVNNSDNRSKLNKPLPVPADSDGCNKC